MADRKGGSRNRRASRRHRADGARVRLEESKLDRSPPFRELMIVLWVQRVMALAGVPHQDVSDDGLLKAVEVVSQGTGWRLLDEVGAAELVNDRAAADLENALAAAVERASG